MCVFDFLFSLPVLVAVAWRVCMIKRTKQTKKCWEKLCSHRPKQQKRERGLFLVGGVYVLVCVPSRFCCEYVFVAVAVTVRLRSSSILWAPGAWIGLCVCFCFVFVSSARSFSLCLSVLSHCLCLSQLFSLLTCTDLHLNLITFTRKYYLFYYVFLLPLICNNSCILRDATVCVFLCLLSAQYRRGRFCPIVPACLRVCLVCCLWGGVILFTCNSSIGFLLVVGVAELFFYY